ncbi:PhnD/SsuA/transferrin family substrate-binding protein [Acanthopleuribacter pedis]|uniref:Phosphate/phosphite/phosphonate ABC transporter substrate-binding protein n=1 Tax=Acanthopleuribacter pedis TaxID=442870 RepID=A0A8J7Q6R3_9BACT|nr:PhnD/SsuA/transferrin family substrate-binding protein [Acanthopleuribacter pedis]MBO1317779.1 hypothetical protein [Acanthopleuribacter pedis]
MSAAWEFFGWILAKAPLRAGSLCRLLFFLVPMVLFAQHPAEKTVYFYSSETNINNFSLLKSEFDAFFLSHGGFRFQPFREKGQFELQVHAQPSGVFLVSSWHFRDLAESLDLEPVLVGSFRGQNTYKKILITRKGVTEFPPKKRLTIASSGSEEYAHVLLAQMAGDRLSPKDYRLLTVPKDIDALMSVGFGMADAALATERSLEKLADLNPTLYRGTVKQAESEQVMLPIVVVKTGMDGEARAVIQSFESMSDKAEGRRKLKLLGLDDWTALSDDQRRQLLQKKRGAL